MLNPEDVDKFYGIERVIFYKNGCQIIRKRRFPAPPPKNNGRNGIFEMSKKSKMLLAHIVANCEIKFNSMATLTYGDFFIPCDGRELKKQLELFLNSLRRRFTCEYIWFVEFTKKDRPHIHIITTVQPNDFDREWLGQRWSTISVVNYFRRIRENKTNCKLDPTKPIDEWIVLDECVKVGHVHSHPKCWEKIHKQDGATRYVFKYATKSDQKIVPPSFHNIGRFWGTSSNVKALPIGELVVGEQITEEQAKDIFAYHRVGQLPLLPRHVLQSDALEYFRLEGKKLSEVIRIFDPKLTAKFHKKDVS